MSFDPTKLKKIMQLANNGLETQFAEPRNANMTLDDRYTVKDMTELFITSSADKDFHVEGGYELLNRTLGFLVNYGLPESDTFSLVLMGIGSVSMRTLKTLQQHGSVFDIILESSLQKVPETSSSNISVINIVIKIYKSHVASKKLNMWTQSNQLTPNDNVTGLVMNNSSKVLSKAIICLVNNMAIEDWEPSWTSSRVNADNSYMMTASNVRRITYSFFNYLKEQIGEHLLLNCVIVSETIDSVPTLTLMFFCRCIDEDNDDDDDDDDEKKEVPAPASSVSNKNTKALRLHELKQSNSTIAKNKPKDKGLFQKIASLFS